MRTHFSQIQLVPNILEMFCRAFLSEQAGSGFSGSFGDAECQSSGDCPAAKCNDGAGAGAGAEAGADGAWEKEKRGCTEDANGKMECVRGRCTYPFGYHHIALDVGLERYVYYYYFFN